MKRLFGKFHYGEAGFTLIELLVVVAILGVLAAVAVPNVGKFMNKGKEQAQQTELHNIQTGVMAMMADAHLSLLDQDDVNTIDMDTITANSGNYTLSDYLTGLNTEGEAQVAKDQAYQYNFQQDGTVSVATP